MKRAPLATLLAVVCTPVFANANTPTDDVTDVPGYRSENTALAISLGGTAASVALFGIGLGADNTGLATAGALSSFLTPSLGHWYAADFLTPGMGIRAVGAGTMFVGLLQEFGCWNHEVECDNSSGDALLYVGAGAYVLGTVYDIATARSAAREHNEGLHITSIAPTALQNGNGQFAMGMGIGGTF